MIEMKLVRSKKLFKDMVVDWEWLDGGENGPPVVITGGVAVIGGERSFSYSSLTG